MTFLCANLECYAEFEGTSAKAHRAGWFVPRWEDPENTWCPDHIPDSIREWRTRKQYVESCVFCQIIHGKAHANVVWKGPHSIAFTPLNPAAKGHTLFVPKAHYDNAKQAPGIAGAVAGDAARWAGDKYVDFNLITSSGKQATQSVLHLHVHVIPRSKSDGLPDHWPWLNIEN